MSDKKDLPRESFPGGDVTPEEGELRVSVDKKVYAEVMSHAKEEPDIEICGVFLGRVKDDGRGAFLHIERSVRGENAKGQGAQVTFTHDTWNHIYKEQDKTSPRLDIVGWYHTHPGFDIFLSEHDKFIHSNFFSSPTQVAYVYDPHQGTEGFFRQEKDGPALMKRYWHGSKQRKIVPAEQRVKAATGAGGGSSGGGSGSVGGDVAASITALNDSVRRLELEVRQMDRGGLGNFIVMFAMVLVLIVFMTMQSCWKTSKVLMPLEVDSKTGQWIYVEVEVPGTLRKKDPEEKKPEEKKDEKK
jgi:proteasome lid subunit RPN8/RPN11